MSFFELHYMGGLEFMVSLSLTALSIIVIASFKGFALLKTSHNPSSSLKEELNWIIYLGSFAFFWGILGHSIGIYSALDAIERAGDISPSVLAGGLRISLIVPIYGLIIFILSSIVWFLLRYRYFRLENKVPIK